MTMTRETSNVLAAEHIRAGFENHVPARTGGSVGHGGEGGRQTDKSLMERLGLPLDTDRVQLVGLLRYLHGVGVAKQAVVATRSVFLQQLAAAAPDGRAAVSSVLAIATSSQFPDIIGRLSGS